MKRLERLYAIQWRARGGWCWHTDYTSVDRDTARVEMEILARRKRYASIEYRLVTMTGEWKRVRR